MPISPQQTQDFFLPTAAGACLVPDFRAVHAAGGASSRGWQPPTSPAKQLLSKPHLQTAWQRHAPGCLVLVPCPAGLYPASWRLPLDPAMVQRALQAQQAAQQPPGGFGEDQVGQRLKHFEGRENAWLAGTGRLSTPGLLLACRKSHQLLQMALLPTQLLECHH